MRKIVAVLASLLTLAVVCGASAPHTPAVIGPIVRVNAVGSGAAFQMWAYADPNDPRYMLVCGNQLDPVISDLLSGYVYATADGGKTWHRTLRDDSAHWMSEENCAYGSAGHAYYTAGVSTGLAHSFENGGYLHVFSSEDHGMTWTRRWIQKTGWVDWTYLQAVPQGPGRLDKVIVFANDAYNGAAHHWLTRLPVAMQSVDGARSFSKIVSSTQPPGHRFSGVFASGSALLADSIVLFSAAPQLQTLVTVSKVKQKHVRPTVTTFMFDPMSNTLTYRPIVHIAPPSADIFTSVIVQDRSGGLLNGRLYLAWIESDPPFPGHQDIWLATSNDRGYHWSTRLIFPNSSASGVRLAVNRTGVLGIAWSDAQGNVLFSSSIDGGKRFAATSVVSTYAIDNTPYVYDVVSSDEYMFNEGIAFSKFRRSPEPYIDEDHLGLSVRVRQGQYIGDISLIADGNGTFHVFWEQPDRLNDHTVLTRTIAVSSEQADNLSTLRAPIHQERPLTFHPVLLAPPHWGSFEIYGKREITPSVQLDFSNIKYNPAMHTLSLDVTLVNASNRVIQGPLSFVGVGLHSDFGIAHALNANNVLGDRLYWDAAHILPVAGLRPHARSRPLHMEFRVLNYKPLPDFEPGIMGDMVAMHVHILSYK